MVPEGAVMQISHPRQDDQQQGVRLALERDYSSMASLRSQESSALKTHATSLAISLLLIWIGYLCRAVWRRNPESTWVLRQLPRFLGDFRIAESQIYLSQIPTAVCRLYYAWIARRPIDLDAALRRYE